MDKIIPANITADRIVDLTFANYTVPAAGIAPGPFQSIFITNFLINSQLTLDNGSGSFPTGTQVIVSATNNGILPSPLLPNTIYYTIFVDASHVLLATSLTNALNNIFITLTSNGSGTGVNLITAQSIAPINQPTQTSLVYPLRIINKATYWNVVRQTNLLSRPGFIFLNKQATESFITVYPVPDQPYPYSIQVKSMINELNAQDDLTELPPFYYGFLKYALARKWMAYYPSGNWPQTNEDEYNDYYNAMKNANETDLTLRPSVVMTAPEPFYWPNILSY